jgi:hypothetical protein
MNTKYSNDYYFKPLGYKLYDKHYYFGSTSSGSPTTIPHRLRNNSNDCFEFAKQLYSSIHSSSSPPTEEDIFKYYFSDNISKDAQGKPQFIKDLQEIKIKINSKTDNEILKQFLQNIKDRNTKYYQDYESIFDEHI